MKLKIYGLDGALTGEEIELASDVFDIAPNDHAIALAVTAELAHNRQGNASTKNRKFVRGGGRKPWKQKGRGVARAGSTRSPIWKGGGTIFGPQPHFYFFKVNKKINRLARRSALAYKAQEDSIRIIPDFQWEDGKSANARNLLKAFGIKSGNVLLLTAGCSHSIYQACKNLPGFQVNNAIDASTKQIVSCKTLFIQKSALPALQEALVK